MKKFLIAVALLMLATTLFLASCTENTPSDNSLTSNDSSLSESKNENENNSTVNDVSTDDASSEDNNTNNNGNSNKPSVDSTGNGLLEVLYCTYSEKPYFAMVGLCEDGATVTAKCNGETVTSESYKGWFSLRLKCTSATAEVKLSQTRDGKELSTLNYKARPKNQAAEMWKVVTGKNFQFFFQKMLPDFQGTNNYADYVYTNLTNKTRNRINQLHTINPDAEIVYLIVPSAMTVYPELVPEQYKPATGPTRLDRTMDALEAGGATVIDLKELFAEHKNDEMPLYYKLDSHWADYGAYVAYDALFTHISERFPDAKPREIDEFNWNPAYYQSGDMTYYLMMSQAKVKEYAYYRTFDFSVPADILAVPRYRSAQMLCYSDEVTWENTIKTFRDTLPNITVMRDSYSTQIYDLIPERANNTYYKGMWDYTWDINSLTYQNPDYVVYVVAEWNIDSIAY